jgi:hypothetical protein
MSGGIISSNTADSGGGVYVSDSGTFTMSGGIISSNTADSGGGVYVSGSGTFTMSGGVISGNTANFNGGGVYLGPYGTFRIVTGTIYGTNEADETLRNTSDAENKAALSGRAQYGIFSGETWNSNGVLDSIDNTIKVVNGELQ